VDDWALEHATHIYDRPDDDGMLYPLATELATLNVISVKQFAPELLGRYSTDSTFRQSVDVRLRHATEDVALDYYQGLGGCTQGHHPGFSRGTGQAGGRRETGRARFA